MLDDVKTEASERMEKSLEALVHNFNKIRTGRAHPSLLDGIKVDYYGSSTPLGQVANINVEDARTLVLTVWDKSMIQDVVESDFTLAYNPFKDFLEANKNRSCKGTIKKLAGTITSCTQFPGCLASKPDTESGIKPDFAIRSVCWK